MARQSSSLSAHIQLVQRLLIQSRHSTSVLALTLQPRASGGPGGQFSALGLQSYGEGMSDRALCVPAHLLGTRAARSTHAQLPADTAQSAPVKKGMPAPEAGLHDASASHQQAQGLAQQLGQQRSSQVQGPFPGLSCGPVHPHLPGPPPPLRTPHAALPQLPQKQAGQAQSLRTGLSASLVLDTPPTVHGLVLQPQMPAATNAKLKRPARMSVGWAHCITWGLPAFSLVIAGAACELLLLPLWAPGGVSVGTLLAEGIWAAMGISTDLASLLAGCTGLELVQAFSLTRKVAQLALLDACLRWTTGGRAHSVFNLQLKAPMDKSHGWYRWACWGLAGFAAVSLAWQGIQAIGSQLQLPLTAGTGNILPVATPDERTLPLRARWWLDTCIVVPVLEEALFRGFMLTTLTKYLPVWAALLASSGGFAACHITHAPLGDLPLIAAQGAILGLVMLRTRNLLAPIAAHSMNNTAALLSAGS